MICCNREYDLTHKLCKIREGYFKTLLFFLIAGADFGAPAGT
jgi:hypothetical protein